MEVDMAVVEVVPEKPASITMPLVTFLKGVTVLSTVLAGLQHIMQAAGAVVAIMQVDK